MLLITARPSDEPGRLNSSYSQAGRVPVAEPVIPSAGGGLIQRRAVYTEDLPRGQGLVHQCRDSDTVFAMSDRATKPTTEATDTTPPAAKTPPMRVDDKF
jgi:hypothetical protein